MDLSASSRDDSKKTRKKKRKKYKKIAGFEKEDFTPQQEHGNDDGETEEEKGEATMVFGDPNCLMSPQKNRRSKRVANAPANSRRKVQWNDENGKKLVHVREFVPSMLVKSCSQDDYSWCHHVTVKIYRFKCDSSDDDYDDDGFDSCVCVLM